MKKEFQKSTETVITGPGGGGGGITGDDMGIITRGDGGGGSVSRYPTGWAPPQA